MCYGMLHNCLILDIISRPEFYLDRSVLRFFSRTIPILLPEFEAKHKSRTVTETTSVYWAQVNWLHLKMEIESNLRNIVF
jgi:hypothetical protein